jgi:hypothetical protein
MLIALVFGSWSVQLNSETVFCDGQGLAEEVENESGEDAPELFPAEAHVVLNASKSASPPVDTCSHPVERLDDRRLYKPPQV